jgi:hypothetical protein
VWYRITENFMLKKIMILVLKNKNKKQNGGRKTESLCTIENHTFINQNAFYNTNAYVFHQSYILHKRKAKSNSLLQFLLNHFLSVHYLCNLYQNSYSISQYIPHHNVDTYIYHYHTAHLYPFCRCRGSCLVITLVQGSFHMLWAVVGLLLFPTPLFGIGNIGVHSFPTKTL